MIPIEIELYNKRNYPKWVIYFLLLASTLNLRIKIIIYARYRRTKSKTRTKEK